MESLFEDKGTKFRYFRLRHDSTGKTVYYKISAEFFRREGFQLCSRSTKFSKRFHLSIYFLLSFRYTNATLFTFLTISDKYKYLKDVVAAFYFFFTPNQLNCSF